VVLTAVTVQEQGRRRCGRCSWLGYDTLPVSRRILRGNLAELAAILEQAGKEQLAATMRELSGQPERTASTILIFLSSAVHFAVDPRLLPSVLPGEGGGLDLEKLARSRESLYLIAAATGNGATAEPACQSAPRCAAVLAGLDQAAQSNSVGFHAAFAGPRCQHLAKLIGRLKIAGRQQQEVRRCTPDQPD
jgi:hypothetical protein